MATCFSCKYLAPELLNKIQEYGGQIATSRMVLLRSPMGLRYRAFFKGDLTRDMHIHDMYFYPHMYIMNRFIA